MPTADARRVNKVTLHFDPSCPWTWQTSRWLVAAADARGVAVEYAAFELTAGEPIDQLAAERRDTGQASRAFLRGVTAARADGQHDLVGRWYTEFGRSHWDDEREPSIDLVRSTLESVGGHHLVGALDDPGLDEPMAEARRAALEWAGDDAGSPVTVWDLDGRQRGFFGPVVATAPRASSDALWDAVVTAATVPELFELKARRTDSPAR